VVKNFDAKFTRFDRIHERDRHTGRHTDRHRMTTGRACTASRDKNRDMWSTAGSSRVITWSSRVITTVLRGVYGDTTQLNSTRRRVELSWVSKVSIATQLNSTRRRVVRHVHSVNNCHLSINVYSDPVDSVCRSWRHKQKHDWLGCTLFNWISWLSCVAIDTRL